MKVKRISAIIGIVLILSMYLISFIAAFFATELAPGLFFASVFATVAIPIMIYGFLLIYKHAPKNNKPENSDEAQNNGEEMDPLEEETEDQQE